MHVPASNDTTLISKGPSTIDKENVIIVPGQNKTPLSVLNDDIFEQLVLSYLFPKGKFGYDVHQDVPVSVIRYFRQRLLEFNLIFDFDPHYIIFDTPVYKKHYLPSSINLLMHKVKADQLTAGTIKEFYRVTTDIFEAINNAFSFMGSVKVRLQY